MASRSVFRGSSLPLLVLLLCSPAPPASGDGTRLPAGRTGPPAEAEGPIVVRVGGVSPADPVVLPLLGVVSGPDPCPNSPAPDLTPELHDVGILTIRNNDYWDDRLDIEQIFQCPGGATYPSWEGCDPENDANYHWEASDAQFESWLRGGFEPFLRLGGEAQADGRHHDFAGPQNAIQEANWIVAATKTAERYVFWNGDEPLFPYLDIWTEWPAAQFWDRDDAAFCAFWIEAYRALKERFPEQRIGGPGFNAAVTTAVAQGRENKAVRFLTALHEAGIRPDWIGWHLFSNHPERFGAAARNFRHLLEGTGAFSTVPWAGTGFFSGVEMIVDAYGLSELKQAEDGSMVPMSREELDRLHNHGLGAALLTASWIELQYTEVTRAYIYRCGDPRSDPGADPSTVAPNVVWSGLFFGDPAGTSKPTAHAVRLWSTVVQGYPVLLQVVPAAAGVPLWTLAARDDGGNLALLLANTGPDTLEWLPLLVPQSGLPVDLQAEALLQVSDRDDGRTPLPVHGWPLEIPGESVQLVTFRPPSR